MNEFPRILVEAAVAIVLTLVAFGGLVYAVTQSIRGARSPDIPFWRRLVATVGLLAVVMQAGLLVAYWAWPRIGREPQLLGTWARWTLPPFVVALLCVFAAKGSSRWWLLASSVLLFVLCFFITLTP